MKVLVIGASGTIGTAVSSSLSRRHEVLRASRSKCPLTFDLTDQASVRRLYSQVGKVDAIVSAAGQAAFRPFSALTDEDFELGLRNKLMGQVNLVRLGVETLTDGGSFTLTSGVLARKPMHGSVAVSMVNAALEGFVRGAAIELPRGIRINTVSPPWITETLIALKMDPGIGTPAAAVAKAYVQAVEGRMSGEVIDASGGGC